MGSPWDALRSVGEDVGDAADFLRDSSGEAKTALGRSVKAASRSMCASASRGADWLLGLSPGGYQGVVDLCTPFWDDNGSGPPVLSQDAPGFSGGQCVGVGYRLSYGTFNLGFVFCSDQGIPQSQTIEGGVFLTGVVGPITSIRTELYGSGPCGDFNVGARVITPSSNQLVFITGGNNATRITSAPIAYSVARSDGQPDICGNPPVPPPTLEPNPNPLPDPGYGPGEEPFPDPTGKPVIPLPPITDPFGRPIRLPDIKLPDVSDPFPFGDAPGAIGPGVAGDPAATGPGGEAEGSEPGKTLVGVQVALTLIPSYARIVETQAEDFYIGACYVYLGLPGRLDLQEEGRYVKNPQFFYAQQPADSWRVVASPGYSLTVTPYYVQETQTI